MAPVATATAVGQSSRRPLLRDWFDVKHVVVVGRLQSSRSLLFGVFRTEHCSRFDRTAARLFEIAFEDDERRRFGAPATVTLTGAIARFVRGTGLVVPEVGRRWFVTTSEFDLDLPASLATHFVPCLSDPPTLGVAHGVTDGRERDNPVVVTGGRARRGCTL